MEFYKYTYDALVKELGQEKADEKVDYYKGLSEQYKSTPTFVVHHCELLNTAPKLTKVIKLNPNRYDR